MFFFAEGAGENAVSSFSSDLKVEANLLAICHFHVTLEILLNKLDSSKIKVNVFQIKMSFLQVKLQTLQDDWIFFFFIPLPLRPTCFF